MIYPSQRTVNEWRVVFWIAFGVFMVTNLVYVIWASGETQPWNTPHLMNKSIENNSTSEADDDSQATKSIEELKRDSLKQYS